MTTKKPDAPERVVAKSQRKQLTELRAMRRKIATHNAALEDLYAARIEAWQRGKRNGISLSVMAEESGVAATLLTRMLKRERTRQPA